MALGAPPFHNPPPPKTSCGGFKGPASPPPPSKIFTSPGTPEGDGKPGVRQVQTLTEPATVDVSEAVLERWNCKDAQPSSVHSCPNVGDENR